MTKKNLFIVEPCVLAQKNRVQKRLGISKDINVAMNYGGHDELIRAVRAVSGRVLSGDLKPEDIDEACLEGELDTAGLPPVDYVIRTSGDQRLSNFLLWQTAYAEFYFTNVNWPDFTPACFVQALREFGNRDRRFGGLTKK